MAPTPSEEPIRVHLTGFGPFRQYSENPSWLAVKPLEGITLTSPPPPLDATPIAATSSPRRRRPIVLSTSLLPVTYNSALTLVPPLHEKGHDLIIHVGVGSPGEIKLEQRARRWGYEKEGADGEWAPQEKGEGGRRGFVGKEWDLGDELKTKVRGEEVVRSVRGRGVEHVGLSEDAGLYLCEFTFFASLAIARRKGSVTPVQFIHVPPLQEPYDVEQLTSALKLLVWGIVREGGLQSEVE